MLDRQLCYNINGIGDNFDGVNIATQIKLNLEEITRIPYCRIHMLNTLDMNVNASFLSTKPGPNERILFPKYERKEFLHHSYYLDFLFYSR